MSEEAKVLEAVLCVDDEEYVLSSLKRTFRNLPLRVLTAASGQAALEIMAREPVRVVIADQRMPEMLGTELLARVKELYPHVIRIILSAYPEVPALLRAINEGEVYRFISKPWDDPALRSLVERAVNQSRVIEEMMGLSRFLKEKNQNGGEINFKVEYLGNLIRMGISDNHHPMSAEQIVGLLEQLFDLKPAGIVLEAIGYSLVRQNGKLTFMTEVGHDLQLVLEFPISKREELNGG